MVHARSFKVLQSHLRAGSVYRRDVLAKYSKAVDRDITILLSNGIIIKFAPGLYYKPRESHFGILPPEDSVLVKAFLRDDDFLIFSWNQYNNLNIGLTQLYNRLIVYNRKRHGVFQLGNKTFDFRRPSRGFPKKLTAEFLMVDLVNNLNELSEDVVYVKGNIQKQVDHVDRQLLLKLAMKYGKIATQKFFEEACGL